MSDKSTLMFLCWGACQCTYAQFSFWWFFFIYVYIKKKKKGEYTINVGTWSLSIVRLWSCKFWV